MTDEKSDHPWRETPAAQMLKEGLERAHLEGSSLRKLAQRLNYKQAVVLSHMASGRVPIPIDRAPDLARVIGLPVRHFLEMCLEQRHPAVDWKIMNDTRDGFVHELRRLAIKPLDTLPVGRQRIIREVVADPDPSRRWVTISELAALELLRELRPNIAGDGLSSSDRRALREALS